jgi:DNA polymerase III delta subunit
MEQFFRSAAFKARDAMREGDRVALQEQIDFCRQWGGPLELVALVAEQHLQLMEQGKLQRAAGTAGQTPVAESPLLQLLRERRAAEST